MKKGLESDIIEQLLEDADFKKHYEFSKQVLLEKAQNLPAEEEIVKEIYSKLLNFYPDYYVTPFLPIYAKDCFIFGCSGDVYLETGSYGMLGYGHNPEGLNQVLAKDQTMANVATPSLAQYEFGKKLFSKIGLKRKNGCPYARYLCMNSGSEALAVALRISDYRTKLVVKEGFKPKYLTFKQSFHGRTYQPAMASDSSKKSYQALASYDPDRTITISPNDINALEEVFANAEKEKYFIEAFLVEPVMGEGNPGMGLTAEFYKAARRITKEHNAILIVDSVQAGMRGHGVLSVVDYPGFEELDAPDLEAFSKAISAGNYPLSVLVINKDVEQYFKHGLYGNTMTANPRGLDIANFVFDKFTDDISDNIVKQGIYFKEQLLKLQSEFSSVILEIQGTGLLLSAEINLDFPVFGMDGLERRLKLKGVNVIHGGKNALRFTPPFTIKKLYIDLIIEVIRREFKKLA